MNKAILTVAGTAVVASTVGAVAGYFIARQKLEAEYNKRFDEEMAEALDAYDIRHKTGKYESLESVAAERLPKRTPKKPYIPDGMDDTPYEPPLVTDEDLVKAVEHLKNYDTPDDEVAEDWANKVVTENPYSEGDTTTDRETPYIISLEVWSAKEKDYHTPQLFYYAVDKVLTDSDGDQIDIAQHVGSVDNLKFGYMSNHENWVYIRNDELACDFEIEKLDEKFEK